MASICVHPVIVINSMQRTLSWLVGGYLHIYCTSHTLQVVQCEISETPHKLLTAKQTHSDDENLFLVHVDLNKINKQLVLLEFSAGLSLRFLKRGWNILYGVVR